MNGSFASDLIAIFMEKWLQFKYCNTTTGNFSSVICLLFSPNKEALPITSGSQPKAINAKKKSVYNIKFMLLAFYLRLCLTENHINNLYSQVRKKYAQSPTFFFFEYHIVRVIVQMHHYCTFLRIFRVHNFKFTF